MVVAMVLIFAKLLILMLILAWGVGFGKREKKRAFLDFLCNIAHGVLFPYSFSEGRLSQKTLISVYFKDSSL